MTDPASQEDGSSEAMMSAMMGFSSFSTSGSKGRTKDKRTKSDHSASSQLQQPHLSGSNTEPLAQPPSKHLKYNDPSLAPASILPPKPTTAVPAVGPPGIDSSSTNTSIASDPAPHHPALSTTAEQTDPTSSRSTTTMTRSNDSITGPSSSRAAFDQGTPRGQQQQQAETAAIPIATTHPSSDYNGITITRRFPGGGYSFVTTNGDVGYFSPNFIIDDPWKELRERVERG